jgi:hypothetical protein
MQRLTFTLALISLISLSCKIPITHDQEEIITPFSVGDTLIFSSTKSLKDTIVICEKSKYFEELNPIFGNTFYRPENAYVKFYNTKEGKEFVHDLVHIYGGSTPSDSARIVIEMRAYYCFLSETNTDLGKKVNMPLEINGKIYNDYYVRTPHCEDCPVEKDSCDIVQLYWNLSKGPLKYVDIRNDTWSRVK